MEVRSNLSVGDIPLVHMRMESENMVGYMRAVVGIYIVTILCSWDTVVVLAPRKRMVATHMENINLLE